MLEQEWLEIRRLMEESGSDAVFTYVDRFARQDQMDLYAMSARKFFLEDWGGKTLDRYADYANHVIERYEVKAAASFHREEADEYRQFVNVLSYNYSANLAECWPGDEIALAERHFRAGLAAAERCIALRIQLHKDYLSMSRAYWLAGAHHLALRQFASAEQVFVTAYRYSMNAPESDLPIVCEKGAPLDALLNIGYLGVARWAAGDGGGQPLFEGACEALALVEEKKDDARFFVEQLQHVQGLYVG